MFLKWILFIIISFIIIYSIHGWIDTLIKTRQKTRDLVKSQTSKYKEMLEQLLDTHSANPEEDDLVAFSRSLETEVL